MAALNQPEAATLRLGDNMNELEIAAQKLTESLCVYRTTKRGEHLAQLRQAVWNMEDAVDAAFTARNIELDCELARFKRQAFGI